MWMRQEGIKEAAIFFLDSPLIFSGAGREMLSDSVYSNWWTKGTRNSSNVILCFIFPTFSAKFVCKMQQNNSILSPILCGRKRLTVVHKICEWSPCNWYFSDTVTIFFFFALRHNKTKEAEDKINQYKLLTVNKIQNFLQYLDVGYWNPHSPCCLYLENV